MKLLLLNGNTDAALSEALARKAEASLARMGRADIRVVPATARFGARYISTRVAAAIAGHAVLDVLAERIGGTNPDGFDAVMIACFGDPGLEAAKEMSPIPVIGMAEASLVAGFRCASRIAFLTGGAGWVQMLTEFCALRGFGPDKVLVRSVPPTGDMIARDPDGALALLAEGAGRAVAAGAGAIVLGGAGLAGLAALLAPALPVPVLDSLDCLLEEAVKQTAADKEPLPPPPVPVPSVNLAPALARLLGP